MSGPRKQSLAAHHLTEAIKHLTAAAEFVRELPDRDDISPMELLALTVEGAVEMIRAVRSHVEKPQG